MGQGEEVEVELSDKVRSRSRATKLPHRGGARSPCAVCTIVDDSGPRSHGYNEQKKTNNVFRSVCSRSSGQFPMAL